MVSSATISTLPGSRLVGRLLMEGSGLSRAMLELVSVGWHAGDGHRLADAVSVHSVHHRPRPPQRGPPCRVGHRPGRAVSLGICAIRAVVRPDLRCEVSASDRERPPVTGVNGTLMARRTAVRPECP